MPSLRFQDPIISAEPYCSHTGVISEPTKKVIAGRWAKWRRSFSPQWTCLTLLDQRRVGSFVSFGGRVVSAEETEASNRMRCSASEVETGQFSLPRRESVWLQPPRINADSRLREDEDWHVN